MHFLRTLPREILHGTLVFFVFLGISVATSGQGTSVAAKVLVGEGWHDWYEVKSDPQNPANVIICGSKLDSLSNAFYGFVYASSDGGMTWHSVLEDRNSSWVSEQSCAFGPDHRAYFISEASKVIDGETHHDLGTMRLYISADGGQQWAETLKTSWADHSTSAVSSPSGRLYTFFNSGPSISDQGKSVGTTVGLLVFSPDGKKAEGPFYSEAMKHFAYHGTYPWGATVLKSGNVVALYIGLAGPPWDQADLGVIRADQSTKPVLESTSISHMVLGKDCPYTGKASLAYDSEQNRLYLLYGDGCKNRRVMLTSSDDEGKTWAKGVVLVEPDTSGHVIYSPSLVASSRNLLGLLWRDGESAGRWYFSYIRDQKLIEPPTELSHDPENTQVSNDSLWTWITAPNEKHGKEVVPEPSITVTVHNALNSVMNVLRGIGLIAIKGKFLAVWPSGDDNGMYLYSSILDHGDSRAGSAQPPDFQDLNVTHQTVLLYGGRQHFDIAAGTFEFCAILANRGETPIQVPVKLEAEGIESPTGTVSVLNATNSMTGAGAVWDISQSVTGVQIPPGAQSNPFCLSFHIAIPPERVSLDAPDILKLKLKVLAPQ